MIPFCELFCINLRIELRMWIQFIFEVLIIMSVYLIVMLNPLPQESGSPEYSRATASYAMSLDKPILTDMSETGQNFDTVAYAPNDNIAAEIAKEVANKFKIANVTGYESAAAMRNDFQPTYFVGLHIRANEQKLEVEISFPNKLRSVSDTSDTSDEDIAQQYWSLRAATNGFGYLGSTDNDETDVYFSEGFVQIQQTVFDHWYNKFMSNKTTTTYKRESTPTFTANEQNSRDDQIRVKRIIADVSHIPMDNMEMKSFEFRHCRNYGESTFYDLLFSFCFLLSFCNQIWKFGCFTAADIPFQFWCRGISYCKFWLNQFFVGMLHLLLLELLILVLIKIDWMDELYVFSDTDTLNFIIFFLLYNTALLLSAMIIVHIITNARNAMLVGISVWLINYVLFGIFMYHSKHKPVHYRYFPIILFFNNCFGYAMHLLRQHTEDTTYLQYCYLAVLGNILLYIIIFILTHFLKPALFVEGIPCKCVRESYSETDIPQPMNNSGQIEYGPHNARLAIHAKKVTTYCNHKNYTNEPHIKVVNMRVFIGEITVLLGSKNSGKTELLSVLGGWKAPKYGSVLHFGKEIYGKGRRSFKSRDAMMTNALIDLLTVRESLMYTVTQKSYGNDGMDKAYMREEIRKWERKFDDFIENQAVLVKSLDYDQKRLLGLCCCLACNTKLVFLDDPTLYMRWREQHLFWELIKAEKQGRAIILSTFDVAEAEIVADRLAILDGGVLLAYGSPYYLRTVFGIEDQLIVLVEPDADVQVITDYLKAYIPRIKPENEIANQIFFNVPYTFRNKYQKILLYLERDKKKLGITHIYMVASELKDVYYRLALNANKIMPHQQLTDDVTPPYQHLSERHMFKQHLRATSAKKFLNQSPALISFIVFVICLALLPLLSFMYDINGNTKSSIGAMRLGFTDSLSDRSILGDYNKCDFIEIRGGNTFSRDTLFCGKGDFMKVLKHNVDYDVSDLIGVVEVNSSNINGWYNVNKFHSAPVTLNLIHNLMLYAKSKDSITTITNYPVGDLNRALIWGSARVQATTHLEDIVVPLLLGVMTAFVVAYIIVELASERINHMMDLYEIAGLNMDAYWIITFLWDFGTYFMDALLFLLAIVVYSMFHYEFAHKLFVFVLILCYGIAIIPNIFVLSMFRYESRFRAYMYTLLYLHTTGVFLFNVYLYVFSKPESFAYAAMLFPSFAFLESVYRLYFCSRMDGCTFESLFTLEEPTILVPIFYLLGECVVWFVVLYLIHDHRKSAKYKKPKQLKSYRSVIDPFDDPDVIELKRKIAAFTRAECLQHRVCVDQVEGFLRKDSRKLDTVSFFLEKQEILCIRGPAHCGKSHFARQLVGIDVIQFGEVYMCKMDLSLDIAKIRSYVGYCPQDGGLFENSTVREMMRIFYMIRGVSEDDTIEKTNQLALLLNIHNILTMEIKELNFVERRKVNIALACVGYNKVLVLDEPTRGLPLHASREIWNTLRYLRFLGMTIIVITSSSMECQVLSDRMMFFRNYSMLAYNSPYNLLKTYGTHIELDIRISADGNTLEEVEINLQKDIENLKRFAHYLHEYSVLVSRTDRWVKFYIPVNNVKYSYIWGALEKNRKLLNIVEYNVSPCSIDHILNVLCKKRKEYRMK